MWTTSNAETVMFESRYTTPGCISMLLTGTSPNTIAAVAGVADGAVWELRAPRRPTARPTAAANAITIRVDAIAGQIVQQLADRGA